MTFSFVIFVLFFAFVFVFFSFLFKLCTVGLYVSLCLMIFSCPFLHCKALRTAMYKRYINFIIIIIIIIIIIVIKNLTTVFIILTTDIYLLSVLWFS